MVTEQQIEAAHTKRWEGYTPEHAKESARVLGALSKKLSDSKIEHTLDTSWPYHLIALVNGQMYSLYNGGMYGPRIDIQKLNAQGASVGSEVSRMTNRGVIDYLLSKRDK